MSATTLATDFILYKWLPPPEPDAYHFTTQAGSVKHRLSWPELNVPPGSEERWSVFEAWCRYSNDPSDEYSFETLLMAHAQAVRKVAVNMVKKHRSNHRLEFRRGRQGDLIGEDMFACGMMGCHDALRQVHRVGFNRDVGQIVVSEHDDDILDQLKSYVCKAARNAMYDELRSTRIPSKVKFVSDIFDEDGEITPEHGYPLTPNVEIEDYEVRERRAEAALAVACTGPHDAWLIEKKEEGRLSETEMGEQIGWSRDRVHRALSRIQCCVEEKLGLEHEPGQKRKARTNDGPDWSDAWRAEKRYLPTV
jgi:RNA polymerase sigma factor (sigma-70 family)